MRILKYLDALGIVNIKTVDCSVLPTIRAIELDVLEFL